MNRQAVGGVPTRSAYATETLPDPDSTDLRTSLTPKRDTSSEPLKILELVGYPASLKCYRKHLSSLYSIKSLTLQNRHLG